MLRLSGLVQCRVRGGFTSRAISKLFKHKRSFSLPRMPSPTPWARGVYPTARRTDHVDIYKSTLRGEVSVPDAYQYLEDHDSSETEQFTIAQAEFTRQYLDQNPNLLPLENAFNDCNNYPKVCEMTDLLASSYYAWRIYFSFMRLSFVTTRDIIGSTTVV